MTVVDKRTVHNKKVNVNNRQRFIKRAKKAVKNAVNKKVGEGNIKDLSNGENVKVNTDKDDSDIQEHTFNNDPNSGKRNTVVPGNDRYSSGDIIDKPPEGGGGGSGKEGSDSEDGEEDFNFILTREEFLELLFEDYELPDMVKRSMKNTNSFKNERRGFSVDGNPSQIDYMRSTKNAQARRLALGRMSKSKFKKIEQSLEDTREKINEVINGVRPDLVELSHEEFFDNFSKELLNHSNVLKELYSEYCEKFEKYNKAIAKKKRIPYYDPVDIRFRRWERVPQPITHAVMFCVMDVSASMGEFEKDIAKRFFLLLYMFLDRQYSSVEIRFIRHTTYAEEVDENTFFYDRKMGGTKISSSLSLVDETISKDIDVESTNVYLAQASDGDNFWGDNDICQNILTSSLMDKIQYYAYIEIDESATNTNYDFLSSDFFKILEGLKSEYSNIKPYMVSDKSKIFNVFDKLFKKKAKSEA